MDDHGEPLFGVSMSGNLTLFAADNSQLANETWSAFSEWQGSFDVTVWPWNSCYTPAINAENSFYVYRQAYGTPACPLWEEPPPADDGGGTEEEVDGNCTGLPQDDPCWNSPIIIDLDVKYELTSVEDGVQFDLRNEGFRRQVAWTRPGVTNFLLCRDVNGNGRIDDGSELFGNHTRLRSGVNAGNGFVALAELDENGDGLVDANDSAWAELLLWNDRNHDGESTADELVAIEASGIAALETAYRTVGRRDRWGNLFREAATLHVWRNGQLHRRTYYDVYLLMDR